MVLNNQLEKDYRRDASRVANELIETFKVTDVDDFDKAFTKYIKETDSDFKERVFKSFLSKEKIRNTIKRETRQEQKPKLTKEKERKFKEVQFVFSGKQKNSKKIQKAVFDKAVNRYRNEKGQFVKRL